MKAQDISDAIGLLDEQMIAEALDATGSAQRARRPESLRRWLALAACACLAVTIAAAAGVVGFGGGGDDGGAVQSDPLVISSHGVAQAKVVSVHEAQPKYFVYRGESYVRKSSIGEVPDSLVGDYIGTVEDGSFNDGDASGAVDMAGNVVGDLHALKGYDAAFMVCLVSPGGAQSAQRQVFVRDSGLVLGTGSELFEDRLHLTGGYDEACVQAHEDWESGREGTQVPLDAPRSALDALVGALDAGRFVSEEEAATEQGWEAMADAPVRRHVVFHMSDGLSLPVNLYATRDAGAWYASYDGLDGAYLRIDARAAAVLGPAGTAYAEAKAAYGRFLQGKEGYYRIMHLAGMDVPALLVSDERDPATDGAFGCTVYEYAGGAVREVGAVQCSSTAYNLCAYQGYLFYGSHHYSGFVTVDAGVLRGEMYTEKWNGGDDNDVSYYKAPLSDGEEGTREKIDVREGAMRLAAEEELGACVVEFAKIG